MNNIEEKEQKIIKLEKEIEVLEDDLENDIVYNEELLSDFRKENLWYCKRVIWSFILSILLLVSAVITIEKYIFTGKLLFTFSIIFLLCCLIGLLFPLSYYFPMKDLKIKLKILKKKEIRK